MELASHKTVQPSRESFSVLTINGGSSSIRFSVYEVGKTLRRSLDGKIDRIGLSGTNLVVNDLAGKPQVPRRLAAADHRTAVGFLLDWLATQPVFASVKAAGHRVVHGMKHSEPELVTPKLLAELRRITPYDPDHLPREIALSSPPFVVFVATHIRDDSVPGCIESPVLDANQ